MPITPFSTTPLSTTPSTFDARMDIRITEQERFVTEANLLALDMNLYATYGPGAALAPSGFKNRIINGGMMVAQGPSVTITAALQYGAVDMMQARISGGTAITGTIGQVATSATSTGFACGISNASWTTGQVQFFHRIEAKNVQDLNGKAISVQAKVFQDTGGSRTLSFVLRKANTLDNFSATTTINGGFGTKDIPSGVVTSMSGSIALSATDAVNGLELIIADGSNTVVNKNYWVGDWDIESGAIVTSFEVQEYGNVLRACRRYSGPISGGYTGPAASGAQNSAFIVFNDNLRAIPVITWSAAILSSVFPSTAPTVTSITSRGFRTAKVASASGQDGIFLDDYFYKCAL